MPHSVSMPAFARPFAPARPRAVDLSDTTDARGGLNAYFRSLGEVEVMSKEAELAAAIRIADRRRALWVALLSHPPMVAKIFAVARDKMSAETCPYDAVAAMQDAQARAGADEATVAAARTALAEAMALADVEGAVSEPLLAELLKARPSPGESGELARHWAEVRAAQVALVAEKNAFVKANLRLVVVIARAYNHGSMPLQDLIQEGNLGLMKAVDRFDHRKGFRFSTYGSWWIRHAIGRSIADKARSVRLPANLASACRKVRRLVSEFETLHGRRPTDDEVATLSGISAAQLGRMRWALVEEPISLDQPLSVETGLTLLDTLGDDSHVAYADALDSSLLHDRLERAFAALTPIEADIVRARAGMDDDAELTLRDLGERHSLSRERIRQIQEQALEKLRRAFKRRPAH